MTGTLLVTTFVDLPLWALPFLLAVALWAGFDSYRRTRNDLRQLRVATQSLADGDLRPHLLPPGFTGLDLARDRITELSEALKQAVDDRAAYVHDSFIQQRDAEEFARKRAQDLVATTSKAVIQELREVVDGVEEVRAAAGTIDDRVSGAHTVAQTVVGKAEQANQVAQALSASLEKVAAMANLIAGIADQTKLLALNANIEAVRAGEVGRGFEVVAGEVKNLAMTTASQTEKIGNIIASIERDAAEMSSSIAGVVASIAEVDDATSGLATVADTQRRTVEQLNSSVAHTINRLEAMERIGEELERRRNDRIPLEGPVEVRVGGRAYSGSLTDFSVTGVGVQLPVGADLAIGTQTEVEFRMGNLELREAAEVVRVRTVAGDQLVGLRFTNLQPSAQAALRGEVQRRLTPMR